MIWLKCGTSFFVVVVVVVVVAKKLETCEGSQSPSFFRCFVKNIGEGLE